MKHIAKPHPLRLLQNYFHSILITKCIILCEPCQSDAPSLGGVAEAIAKLFPLNPVQVCSPQYGDCTQPEISSE